MARKKVFSIGSALSQGLEETIESAQNHSGELRIDVIPIKKIELDPANPRDFSITMLDVVQGIDPIDIHYTRKRNELASLQSIANSIKTQGVINPITVYKFGEKYRLIAGERRTLASLVAGKTDIQAKILDEKPNELKVSLLQWIENIERSDLSLGERLINLEKIIAASAKAKGVLPQDISVTELSELIGCVKSHAMNYKAILTADKQIRDLIFENKIRNLEKAALVAEIRSVEIRKQAINACVAGATLKQLRVFALESIRPPRLIKPVERRGRQATSVNFGATKNIGVAKIIFDSLMQHASLAQLASQFKEINWNNPRSISDTFKNLLKTLEQIHQ